MSKPRSNPKKSLTESVTDICLDRDCDSAPFTKYSQAQLDDDKEMCDRYQRAFTEDDLVQNRDWIFANLGSHEMLSAFIFLRDEQYLGERDLLALLGDLWCACDSVGAYKDELEDFILCVKEDPYALVPELMTREELRAFEALPDQITLYRGCGPRNKAGMSWSLSREKAIFPFSTRHDEPTLLTATISKKRAAALKLERNELEIIVVEMPETWWTEELMTELPPTITKTLGDKMGLLNAEGNHPCIGDSFHVPIWHLAKDQAVTISWE